MIKNISSLGFIFLFYPKCWRGSRGRQRERYDKQRKIRDGQIGSRDTQREGEREKEREREW